MHWMPVFLFTTAFSFAAEIKPQTVAYRQDTAALEGIFISAPTQGKVPGVVLIHDWMGVSPQAQEYAKRVAAMGYAVFVADIYGKNVRPKDASEAGKVAGSFKANIPLLRQRAAAALETMKHQPGVDTTRMAVMGFCFGGGAALELARSGAVLKAAVSVHGNLNTPNPQDARNIKGKVLVLHGAEDPFVSPEQVKNFMDEMRAAGTDWQLQYFGGAVHGFTNPKAGSDPKQGVAYNPNADRRAFESLKNFFMEAL